MFRRLAAFCAAVMLVLCASSSAALAHASLSSCSIRNGETLHARHLPASIKATFAEPLDARKGHSFMQVFEGQGDHGLVTEKQRSIVNFRNPKVMTLPLPKHMPKGTYYLLWYTRSAIDGHYAAGLVHFRVK